MAVTGIIGEFEDGAGEAVLNSLAMIDNVSVYGVKENQIVAVIEGDDMNSVEKTMKVMYAIDGILGVFPVFSGDYPE